MNSSTHIRSSLRLANAVGNFVKKAASLGESSLDICIPDGPWDWYMSAYKLVDFYGKSW